MFSVFDCNRDSRLEGGGKTDGAREWEGAILIAAVRSTVAEWVDRRGLFQSGPRWRLLPARAMPLCVATCARSR